jgi:uncharacterized paraquat-inducible protein A
MEVDELGSRLKSTRREELRLLLKFIPKIEAYRPSLKPEGIRPNGYKYCSRCRIYFNNADSLIACPICHYRLRSPRKAKRVKRSVDPEVYGVEAG